MATLPYRSEPARRGGADAAAGKLRVADYLRRIDWLLLGAIVAISAFGLDVLAGGTQTDVPHDPTFYLHRQQTFFVLGAVALVVATFVNPSVYRRLQWPLAIGTACLIGVVLAIGTTARGGTRWINLPGFQLQPSEVGKLVLVLCLAAFLADRRERIGRWTTTVLALLYAGVAAALVFAEPDLGTSLIYVAAALAMLWVAGTRWTHFLALAVLAVATVALVFSVLPGMGVHVVKGYQAARLTQFLHPNQDISGSGYNQYQATVAVGSGGLVGRGVQGATQTRDDFLPEHHTDFIFATLGEQRGFLGAALLLGLYLVVLWRILRAATIAETFHGSLIAAGVAAWFLFSIFVNVGMTIGLAPITGIPLPLVSYGGSSVVMALAAVGVVQAVQLRGRLSNKPLRR
jgi:rod shape determining protein RodA